MAQNKVVHLRNKETGVVVTASEKVAAVLDGYSPVKASKASKKEPEVSGEEGEYDNLTVAALRDLITDRNGDRFEGDDISTSGNKSTLIAALTADDEAEDTDED